MVFFFIQWNALQFSYSLNFSLKHLSWLNLLWCSGRQFKAVDVCSKVLKRHVKQSWKKWNVYDKLASQLLARSWLCERYYSSLLVLMYLALVHSDLVLTSQNPIGTKITLLYRSRPSFLSFHATSSVHLVYST